MNHPLTRAEEIALQSLLANYRLTPMTLALKLNPKLIPAPHLTYISAIVANAIAKGGGRIIISLPPRHGKSELITKNVPIWTLENFGQKNLILCSYGAELSTDFGRAIRDIIQDNEHLLNLRIREDAQRVNNWLTNAGGAMRSVGLGGPITGRGADVLIIDDYIKEIKESLSELHREYIWNWFITTAFTRLEPNATVIIVATRWHHDDLIGRILKNFPGEWTNIVIPAIAEEGDLLGRPIGAPLFPERYPLDGPQKPNLMESKKVLGSFFFNALYQQRPENDAGKLTNRDWIQFISAIPDLTGFKVERTWDLACTEDGGDYIVGTLMAYSKDRDMTIILDVRRDQIGPLKVEALVASTAKLDGQSVPINIEKEPGSSGKLLIQQYSANALKGYRVNEIPANDGKLIRAQPFLAACEARRVFLVQGPWNEAWLSEYDEFPTGDHDDQVDTASAGYTHLSGNKFLKASWGREQSGDDVELRKVTDLVKQMQNINGNPMTDLIMLPNGKVYKVSDIIANDNEHLTIATRNGGLRVPEKAGVSWGR